MRLIRCYIENFGGLSQYSCQFDQGLTVLLAPNGFGKTTLAEFIRAMFYGFPRAGRALRKDLRKKYRPWQGGKYGGSLEFEHEGVRYRVERSFGAAPKGDTFALYDTETQQRSGRFSEQLGLELFQLDADSFERSTYLPQLREPLSLSTDRIQAKLGDLVEDTNDVNNFEKAMRALREKRSELVPFRGSGGLAGRAQEEISRMEEALRTAEEQSAQLEALRARQAEEQSALQTAEASLDSVRERIRLASEAAGRAAVMEQHDRMTRELAEGEAAEAALRARYPQGVPGQEEIRAALETMDAAARLGPREDAAGQEARRRLAELETRFAAGVPAEEELDAARERCRAWAQADSDRRGARLSEGDLARLQELRDFFSPGLPAQEELSEKKRELDALRRLERENRELAASALRTPPPEPAAQKSGPAFLAALLLGLAAAGGGAGLLAGGAYAAGGVLLGLGVILLVGAVYLRLKAMVTAAPAGPASLGEETQRKIQENDREIRRLSELLSGWAARYFPEGRELAGALAELETLRGECLRLEARQRQAREREAQLALRQRQLQEEIVAFLSPYYNDPVPPEAFDSRLTALQLDCAACRSLRRQAGEARRAETERAERRRGYEAALQAFARPYGLALTLESREAVERIRNDARDWARLREQLEKQRQELKDFRAERQALLKDAGEPGEAGDLEALRRTEQSLRRDISDLSRSLHQREQAIRRAQGEADQLPLLQDELARWRERYTENRRKAALLDDAMTLLQKAKDSLSTSYLGTVRQSFSAYLRRLEDEETGEAYVNPQLEVQLERMGEARDTAYFSAGQSDVIALCMRLALVDALFKDVKPFLILDDPFVNLDDAHMAQALALLEELSRDYQILYLVCNSGRINE